MYAFSLSHSKPKRNTHVHAQILLPPESALLLSPPLFGANKDDSPQGFSTPRSSPDDPAPYKCSHAKSVQFGVSQAAEYDRDAPSAKFTPLPAEIAQERFPLTNKKDENDDAEEEEIAETKVNSAMLAEWDSDFDSLMDEDEEDDASRSSRKRHSSKKDRHHKHKKHPKSNNSSARRSDRRRSTAFGSPGDSKVLYDPASDAVSTPDKQSTLVLDDLAELSMKSPPEGERHETHQHNHQELSQESVMSPVVARNLSAESHSDGGLAMCTVEAKTLLHDEAPVQQFEGRRKVRSRFCTLIRLQCAITWPGQICVSHYFAALSDRSSGSGK